MTKANPDTDRTAKVLLCVGNSMMAMMVPVPYWLSSWPTGRFMAGK
ncbi:MAG: hypothetical protein LRY40_01385 [Shewanella fodinae]|nr:hypothetical protein [Shewanella fodinae]